jgi:hypothetical protein
VPDRCRDTTHAEATADIASYEVWRHRQAPTWVAKRDSILASPASWTRYWPVVRTEAAWTLVTTRPGARSDVGQRMSFTLSDTMQRGWFYAVVTLDTAGNRSCISNEVWR